MSKIGLSVYGFSLIKLESKKRDIELELHDIEGKLFIDIIKDFVEKNSEKYTEDRKLEKVFKCDGILEGEVQEGDKGLFNYICGIVKTGEYGAVSEIVDIETGATEYNKKMNDADVLPFYYLIAVPKNHTTKGILILQSSGRNGIKTIFEKKLQQYMKESSENIRIAIRTVVPIQYINRYMDHGSLQKIRMIRYGIPHDLSERVGINNGVETTYEERIIHRPVGFMTRKGQKIRECLNGQRLCNTIIEIDDFNYDELKLEFKLGKNKKTISLDNIESLNINEDITKHVKQENGHPTQDSIIPILTDTAKSYLVEMGLIIEER